MKHIDVETFLMMTRAKNPKSQMSIDRSVDIWATRTKIDYRARGKTEPKAAKKGAKTSMYFTDEMMAEVGAEAQRLDQSLSKVIQMAWNVSKDELKQFPQSPPRGVQ